MKVEVLSTTVHSSTIVEKVQDGDSLIDAGSYWGPLAWDEVVQVVKYRRCHT